LLLVAPLMPCAASLMASNIVHAMCCHARMPTLVAQLLQLLLLLDSSTWPGRVCCSLPAVCKLTTNVCLLAAAAAGVVILAIHM
jgi:hypothetical protein